LIPSNFNEKPETRSLAIGRRRSRIPTDVFLLRWRVGW